MASNKITVKLRDLDEEEVKRLDALMDLARVFKKHNMGIRDDEIVIDPPRHHQYYYGLESVKHDILEIHRGRICVEGAKGLDDD